MRVSFTSLTELASSSWDNVKEQLSDDLQRLQATINTVWDVSHNTDGTQKGSTFGITLGQIAGNLSDQPSSLTTSNDGLLFFVTDYGHLVRWNGSTLTWSFAPGELGNGYFGDFITPPQAVGWSLCDGSTVSYLVVGGSSLTTASVTLPNLVATSAYRKSAAAYSGTVNAKTGSTGTGSTGTGSTGTGVTGTGSTGTGSTGTGTTGTGTTGNESAHTHSVSGTTSSTNVGFTTNVLISSTQAVTIDIHDHAFSVTSGAGSAHNHSVPTLSVPSLSVPALSVPALSVPALSVPSLSVPALGVGSIEMANLGVLPYFRR